MLQGLSGLGQTFTWPPPETLFCCFSPPFLLLGLSHPARGCWGWAPVLPGPLIICQIAAGWSVWGSSVAVISNGGAPQGNVLYLHSCLLPTPPILSLAICRSSLMTLLRLAVLDMGWNQSAGGKQMTLWSGAAGTVFNRLWSTWEPVLGPRLLMLWWKLFFLSVSLSVYLPIYLCRPSYTGAMLFSIPEFPEVSIPSLSFEVTSLCLISASFYFYIFVLN